MDVPRTDGAGRKARAPVYESYAQLIRMLLPSSGCLAIYDIEGGLVWCSDGFERPEFREIVDAFTGRNRDLEFNRGVVRETSAGVTALIARLGTDNGRAFGYVLIDLGETHSSAGQSMAASMTQPIFRCLSSQLSLERLQAPEPAAASPDGKRLAFLLGIGQTDPDSPHALRLLLQRCVERFDCLSAAFCIPDHQFTEVVDLHGADAQTRRQLDATRKHLLAWVQLNNRPMVVNRVDGSKAPYKILSCPVIDRTHASRGLIALFRGPESPDFEPADVPLIEFLAGQGMALLTWRQDPVSGLMSRVAFERYVDERLSQGRPTGALLYLDIDNLKTVNESFGYSAGDEAIRRTAQLIHRCLNPGEVACRLYADRFVVFVPERNLDQATTLGNELVGVTRSRGFVTCGRRVPLAYSFGVAAASESVTESRHWIAAAEVACQQARAGRPATAYNTIWSPADI